MSSSFMMKPYRYRNEMALATTIYHYSHVIDICIMNSQQLELRVVTCTLLVNLFNNYHWRDHSHMMCTIKSISMIVSLQLKSLHVISIFSLVYFIAYGSCETSSIHKISYWVLVVTHAYIHLLNYIFLTIHLQLLCTIVIQL